MRKSDKRRLAAISQSLSSSSSLRNGRPCICLFQFLCIHHFLYGLAKILEIPAATDLSCLCIVHIPAVPGHDPDASVPLDRDPYISDIVTTIVREIMNAA